MTNQDKLREELGMILDIELHPITGEEWYPIAKKGLINKILKLLSERDSLEQLIEKCIEGNKYLALSNNDSQWNVSISTDADEYDDTFTSGSTPHEAVTKLLESLNKKENGIPNI